MKKKYLILLTLAFALTLCLALVACGDKNGGVKKLTAENGITADGVFESGSVLNTVHHSSDSEQGKVAISAIDKPYDTAKIAVFDIILTKDGEKVQPGGKVKITMPKPFESDAYVTYHVKNDNRVEELVTTIDGNKISFETTSFSYFIVAGLVNADQQHIHSYVEKITDRNLVDNATCQRKAVYRLVCSICGSLGRETFEYGELADHNLREEKGYDPRCEKEGLTHGKRCINPGCTYTEQTAIPAIGHDMQDVAAKEPTCTEIGWKAYRRCSHYCGKIEGYEEIPATGHSMTIHVLSQLARSGAPRSILSVPTRDAIFTPNTRACKHSDTTRNGTSRMTQPAQRTGIGEDMPPAIARGATIRQSLTDTSIRRSDTSSNTTKQKNPTACPAGKRTTNVSVRGATITPRWKFPPTASIVTFATFAPRAASAIP